MGVKILFFSRGTLGQNSMFPEKGGQNSIFFPSALKKGGQNRGAYQPTSLKGSPSPPPPQAVDSLMWGVLCCARRHRKNFFFQLFHHGHYAVIITQLVNHMNICISLNLAINSPIETGCHNENLNMKRGTENCCNNKHWSLWGSQCFTNFLVSRTQPWFRKIYVPEKRQVTKSGKLTCTFITIFSITWAEH